MKYRALYFAAKQHAIRISSLCIFAPRQTTTVTPERGRAQYWVSVAVEVCSIVYCSQALGLCCTSALWKMKSGEDVCDKCIFLNEFLLLIVLGYLKAEEMIRPAR